jgi:hypothetical protein
MRRGMRIDLVLEKGHERLARPSVERRAAIGRRHQARAQLADDFFPGLCIGCDAVQAARLEIQARHLLGRVMAIETNRVDDGRLARAFVADKAAAGRKRADQRGSSK